MPRKLKVVTTTLQGRGRPAIAENRERALDLIDLACGEAPDLICLPENFLLKGLAKAERADLDAVSEPLDGPTLAAVSRRARAQRAWVVCPLLTRREGKVFNSSVLIDRKGAIAGVYDKVHPVTSSDDFTQFEGGIAAGGEAPVFETDFGRVGLQICFDLGFPETWRQLKDRGAELVVWSSAYDGGFGLRVFARLHRYYVVSSVCTHFAQIVDPLGGVLERSGPRLPLISRTIDLDFLVCHYDFHGDRPLALKRQYGDGVTIASCDEEGYFMLSSNLEAVPLARLIEEFGLEAGERYHERHRAALARLRKGEAPEAQRPPYLGRAKNQ